MSSALYVIKGDALDKRIEIRNRLASVGLSLFSYTVGLYSRELADVVYSGPSSDTRAFIYGIYQFLVNTPMEIGVVEGNAAIRSLVQVTGHHYDPRVCEPDTIRHTFGTHAEFPIGSEIYFHNAIHRSQNEIEASREQDFYFNCILIPRLEHILDRALPRQPGELTDAQSFRDYLHSHGIEASDALLKSGTLVPG